MDSLSHFNFKLEMRDIFTFVFRKLSVEILDDTLSTQLHELELPKLHHLKITGHSLQRLEPGALSSFQDSREFVLELTGTQVQDIPPGFFTPLTHSSHLSINLKNNSLTSLSPAAFYGNATSWETVGTKVIAGALILLAVA